MNYGIDDSFIKIYKDKYDFENFYKRCERLSKFKKTEYCLQFIISKLKTSSVSSLIGAGFSLNANLNKNKTEARYKDWAGILVNAYKNINPNSELLTIGSEDEQYDAIKEAIIKNGESNFSAEYVKHYGSRESLDLYIENEFSRIKTSTDNLKLHSKLLSLNWCDILTTNWDSLLERACNGANKKNIINTVYSAKGLKVSNRSRIVKLNGSLRTPVQIRNKEYCFDNTDDYLYVITPDDFAEYKNKHEGFSNFMKIKTLENALCLFGFSGHDTNFRYWINELKSTMKKGGETEDPNPIFLFAPPEQKEKLKPEEKENAKIVKQSEEQFLKNNYIIKLKLEDIDAYLKKEYSKYQMIPENADYLQKTFLMFENLFDFLSENAKKEEVGEFVKLNNINSKIIRQIVYSHERNLSVPEMQAYNSTMLFDFQNLTYSNEFVNKIQRLQNKINEWTNDYYCFIYRWCLNNYYTLQNLYEAKVIQNIVTHYENNILSKNEAPEFIELVLKYYVDSGKRDDFERTIEKYKNNDRVKDFINCQRAYYFYTGFHYKELKEFLKTWIPDEKNAYYSLFMSRKVFFMMEYENINNLSVETLKEIEVCFNKAIYNCKSELQLKYFILLSYKQLAIEQDFNKMKYIDEQIELIENYVVFPRLYFDHFLTTKKSDSIRPNSDLRYTINVQIFNTVNSNNNYINMMRVMNFIDYTGIDHLGLLSSSDLLYITECEQGYDYHIIKTLIKSIRYFGYSSEEDFLRTIVPKLIRKLNINLISELMRQIYEIFDCKINEDEDATIYFYLLGEVSKKADDNAKKVFIINFFNLMKNEICKEDSKSKILDLITKGSVWGWKIPFEYFLDELPKYLKDEKEIAFILRWILDNYLLEDAADANVYHASVFKEYFIYFVGNENNKVIIKNALKEPELEQFFDNNTSLINSIALYIFDYIKEERKKEIITFFEKNYELETDPYFITILNSAYLNNRVIKLLDNYEILNETRLQFNFFYYVKSLCKSKVITDYNLTELINIISKQYNTLKENKERLKHKVYLYKERIESLFISISEIKLAMSNTKFDGYKLFEDLKKDYIEENEDFFTFRWLYEKDLQSFKKNFIQAITIFSYLEEEKKYCYVFNIALAKILLQDSLEFEAVLENFLRIYENNYGNNLFDNETTKTILNELYKKFSNEIPYCYDELFMKEQLKRLEKIITADK